MSQHCLTMFHRTLLSCRVKSRVTILGFSVFIVCSMLMYRALTSHISSNRPAHSPMPDFNLKFTQRSDSDSKHSNIPSVQSMHGTFQKHHPHKQELRNHLLYSNFIPEQSEMLENTDLLSANSRKALRHFLANLYPTDWSKAPEMDEVALDLKYLLLEYGLDSSMTCKQTDSLKLGSSISKSGSKVLEYAYDVGDDGSSSSNVFGYGNRVGGRTLSDKSAYIIRSSSSDMEIRMACIQMGHDPDQCTIMGGYRLLREVLLLSALRHPSILKIKGYCLRGGRVATQLQEKGVVVVTESGAPVTSADISSLAWHHRVSMALQIGQLIMYLGNSPLGSLRLKKLSLRDFVLVNGTTLKLAHVDELELREEPCMEDAHCHVPGAEIGVHCMNGFCKGQNEIINFKMAAQEVFLPLLENPAATEEDALLTNLRIIDVTLTQFLEQLQILFNKSNHEHKLLKQSAMGEENEELVKRLHNIGDHQPVHRRESVSTSGVMSNFIRYDRKNFAGIYDYSCADSRVSWGCVRRVTSLEEAANLCLQDHTCQSFVIFSTQPESDNLMTVVLKNATDSSPYSSSGTTLFVRRTPSDMDPGDKNRNDGNEKNEDLKEMYVEKSPAEVQSCLDRTLQSQESARYTREKRLMAHLGLKGVREQSWRRSVLRQDLAGHSELISAQGGGSRFLATLTNGHADEEAAKKVLFISESGSYVYHMAYAAVYHLDRLLGLYHTPPCVGKHLSLEVVNQYLRDTLWDKIFRPLIESDGTLSGIIVPPVPKVIAPVKLTLEPRQHMITEIEPLTRHEKLQLEYILLWWLGRIDYKEGDHQGYKGHLIHFSADKAFASTSMDITGYLNHCQFPESVYLSLTCFKCGSGLEGTHTNTDICFLGEKVIKQVQAMFADNAEFFIHNMRKEELVAAINSAATTIMQVVDICLKNFGRKRVFY